MQRIRVSTASSKNSDSLLCQLICCMKWVLKVDCQSCTLFLVNDKATQSVTAHVCVLLTLLA